MLKFEPTCEMNVREWFAAHCDDLGYSIILSQAGFPDYMIEDGQGRQIRAEAEYESINFLAHRHNIAECDMVICWWHNITIPLPVLELKTARYYTAGEIVVIEKAKQEWIKYDNPQQVGNKRTDAQRLMQAVEKCAGKYEAFKDAMADDLRAQAAYLDGMTKPRMQLLGVTREFIKALQRAGAKIEQLHPYNLAQIVGVVVQPGRK